MTEVDLLSPIPGELKYQSMSPCSLADQAAIDARPSSGTASEWHDPSFKVFTEDERGRPLTPTKVHALTPGYLAFCRDDLSEVEHILAPFGDFLPIDTTQGPRWYFRPRHYLDGFLAEESGAKYANDGKRIISFRAVVLRNEAVHSTGVFKVAALNRSPVLYRPDIVERLLATKLFLGVEFKVKGRAAT